MVGVDPARVQGVVEGAVPAGEHPGQRQARQRDHRTGAAQLGVGELEQRVRSRLQALMEPGPEPGSAPAPRSAPGLGRIDNRSPCF
jgi:hypothetical protein